MAQVTVSLLPGMFVSGIAAALAACVRREHISVSEAGAGTGPLVERAFWGLQWPVLSGDAHNFNRVVYEAIEDRFEARGSATGERIEPPPLAVTRTVHTIFGPSTERFVVPYGAIDGKAPEYGEGGLMRAYENDAFFYNRLCRYRQ